MFEALVCVCDFKKKNVFVIQKKCIERDMFVEADENLEKLEFRMCRVGVCSNNVWLIGT